MRCHSLLSFCFWHLLIFLFQDDWFSSNRSIYSMIPLFWSPWFSILIFTYLNYLIFVNVAASLQVTKSILCPVACICLVLLLYFSNSCVFVREVVRFRDAETNVLATAWICDEWLCDVALRYLMVNVGLFEAVWCTPLFYLLTRTRLFMVSWIFEWQDSSRPINFSVLRFRAIILHICHLHYVTRALYSDLLSPI